MTNNKIDKELSSEYQDFDTSNFQIVNNSSPDNYKSSVFYESKSKRDVLVCKERGTNNLYYRVSFNMKNILSYHQRYKNFVYIVGNKPPFGPFKGYKQNESQCFIYYKYNPQTSLQNLLKADQTSILDSTVKSEIILAVAASLEYCHTLGVSCRFIHPESIYLEKKKPYLVNFGYSDSILNNHISTFSTRMKNLQSPLFEDIANYILPETPDQHEIIPFSDDIYSFGALLKVLIEDDEEEYDEEEDAHDVIKHIRDKCLSDTPQISSAKILDLLVKIDAPFKKCDKEKYSKYKEKILKNIYYKHDAKPLGNDKRESFVYAARLLKENPNPEPNVKADILQQLIFSANKQYAPAMYELSLFLDSNRDTYLYDVDNPSDYSNYNPLKWMKLAADYGVYNAPILLGEMYERRGLFKQADKVYKKYDTFLCKIKRLIFDNKAEDQAELTVDQAISAIINDSNAIRVPEVIYEAKVLAEVKKLKNKSISATNFERNILNISKNYKENGRIYYLLAILFRDGTLSNKSLRNIDGILPFSQIKDTEDDFSIPTSIDEYEKYLKLAASANYEPAVAEYVVNLLDGDHIEEAENMINLYFQFAKCKNDCSKVRIQHAHAYLLEKKGDLKKAIRLYKDSADSGYIKSNGDYLRLYKRSEDPNPAIIKYYSERFKYFENI